MKTKIFLFITLFFFILSLLSCSDDIELINNGFSVSTPYIASNIGNDTWKEDTSNLGTFYAKVDNIDSPSWIDVVISSDDLNSSSTALIHNYLFIHINNSDLAKNFTLEDSTIYPFSKFSIMYYENRSVSTPISFSLFLRASSGELVITKCDGTYISGYFNGELKNQVTSSDVRPSKIYFSRVPISIAKKSLIEDTY
jgi:hypothetical protein